MFFLRKLVPRLSRVGDDYEWNILEVQTSDSKVGDNSELDPDREPWPSVQSAFAHRQ